MNRGRKTIGLVVGVVATAVSVYFIAASWKGQDLSAYASWRALGSIATCILFYVTGTFISALAWQKLVRGVGIARPWRELAGILSITQIGKYLPGNVAHHIGRASMAFQRGIGPSAFFVTVTTEIALLTIVSVAVGLSALFAADAAFSLGSLGSTRILVAATCFVASLLLGIVILRKYGYGWMQRWMPTYAQHLRDGRLPSAISISQAGMLYVALYLALGTGFILMARLLIPGIAHHGSLLVAAFALAWVIGFITPGAPAGLGTREGVMLLILGSAYRTADASVIIVALRLATTLGDVLLMLLGWLLLRGGSAQHASIQHGVSDKPGIESHES